MTQANGMTPPWGRGLTRRQFLALGWTIAGLVAAAEAGAATLSFMYPRLQAGAFGGKVVNRGRKPGRGYVYAPQAAAL